MTTPRKPRITSGSIYAVTGGKFLGKTLVYIKKDKDHRCFLTLPDMKNHDMTDETFRHGLDIEALDKIEKLPDDIYKICKAQYEKNTNIG